MINITFGKIGNIAKRCLMRFLSPLVTVMEPIRQNKVVFTSFFGRGYSCNPKYILEELHRRDPSLDLVWVTAIPDSSIPSYVRTVQCGTLAMIREYASARVWVDNSRDDKCIRKRAGQLYIQTWHAYCGPKMVEKDAGTNVTANYRRLARWDSADTDYMIADNDLMARIFHHSFWYSGPVLRCGVPRNKPLIHPDAVATQRVRDELGIRDGHLLVLYAPTFRRSGVQPAFDLDYKRLKSAIEERFGKTADIAVRLHPSERDRSDELPADVLNASFYPDGQELLVASDMLITDFSSIAEDFILTGRPGFMYIPDYDQYLSEERGMYYPVTRRPFALAKTSDELLQAIRDFSDEGYKARRQEFFDFIGFKDNGHGDAAVAKFILEQIGRGDARGDKHEG